jgi:hypothetical protein
MQKTTKKKLTQREAARLLGRSEWHLSRVLNGHVVSKSLSRRYAELLLKHGKS